MRTLVAKQNDREFKILYINRDKDVGRRKALEVNLGWLGLGAERITAVEGRKLPQHLQHMFPPSRLSPGEVGCYASHMLAWTKLVENDIPFALVLEDDAAMDKGFAKIINETLAAAPEGWDFIHVSTARRFSHRPLAKLPSGRTLARFSRVPAATRGYLISNAGARKMLKPIPRLFPVDLDTRLPWKFDLDSYGLVEALVGEKSSVSTISPIPSAGRSRLRRGIRLNNPLHTWSGLVFNIKKLGFAWWLRCLAANVSRRIGKSVANIVRFVGTWTANFRSTTLKRAAAKV